MATRRTKGESYWPIRNMGCLPFHTHDRHTPQSGISSTPQPRFCRNCSGILDPRLRGDDNREILRILWPLTTGGGDMSSIPFRGLSALILLLAADTAIA